MKSLQYYKQLFFVMGWLGILPTYTLAQDTMSCSGNLRWDYSESRVKRSPDGNSLDIEIAIKPLARLKGQEMAYIFPRYVSADGKDSVKLEPFCISGKRRYKVIKRRKALHNLSPNHPGAEAVYSIKELKEAPLTFTNSFPFERWMANGRIVVEEKLYGCAECGINVNDGIAMQSNIPFFGEKDYAYDFITPEKAEVKCYWDSFACKVVFPVAGHKLHKGFANNARQLEELEKFISENLSLQKGILKEVYIKGYASPEGAFDYNKKLAERRTRTLSDYVSQAYPELQKASVYQAIGIGEDWEGLRTEVEKSSLSNKAEILSIIDRHESDTEREAAIRELDNGKTYRMLLKEYYPALRRTTFRLNFDARPYTIDELAKIFGAKPECLNQYEMHQLAQSYASGGKSPVPVYQKAYEQFPGNAVATLNYANALLKYEKDADGALQVLEAIKDEGRALFPMAIAYDMKGDWRKAEALLQAAAAHGDSRAKAFGMMPGNKK